MLSFTSVYNKINHFIFGDSSTEPRNENKAEHPQEKMPKSRHDSGEINHGQQNTNYRRALKQIGKGIILFVAGGTLGYFIYPRTKNNRLILEKEEQRLSERETHLFESDTPFDLSEKFASLDIKESDDFKNVKSSYPLITRSLLSLEKGVEIDDNDEVAIEWEGQARKKSEKSGNILLETPQPEFQSGRRAIQKSYVGRDEFQINSYTTLEQRWPAVSGLSNGGFVVVWHSNGQDGDGTGIYANLYDAMGQGIGNESQVNTYTTLNQNWPSVTQLNGGKFVIVWVSDGQDGNDLEIYGQQFTTAGDKVSGEFKVNTYTTSTQEAPNVHRLEDGGFVVVWQSLNQDATDYSIYGQRYNATGQKTATEFQINLNYKTGVQARPWVNGLNGGGFVVTWIDSGGFDGDSYGIFGQCYNVTGYAVVGEFQVNSYTTLGQQYPHMSSLNNGDFVVVWTDFNQDGSGSGVYGQRFDALCSKVGSEFRINSYTTANQVNAAVSGLAAGGFVVVWDSASQDGDGRGIYGQLFTPLAQKVGEIFQVNTYTTDDQRIPIVARIDNGGFVVVWESNLQDGNDYGCYGRVFTPIQPPFPYEYLIAAGGILAGLVVTTACVAVITATGIYLSKKIKQRKLQTQNRIVSVELLDKESLTIEDMHKHIPKSWFVSFKNIRVEEKLASGGGGIVFKAMWENTPVVYKICQLNTEEEVKQFSREVKLMMKSKHPNIVQAFGICIEPRRTGIVMEFMPMGSLERVLHDDTIKLTWMTRYNLSCDISTGLAYLHNHDVLHRDLKSANILIYESEKKLHAKITDLGLSKHQTQENQTATSRTIGTYQWMAPDLFAEGKPVYTKQCDIYSTGIIFWEIATRARPFAEVKNTMIIPMRVGQGTLALETPKNCPLSYATLMKRCWDLRAANRPSAKILVEYLQESKNKNEIINYNKQKTTPGRLQDKEMEAEVPEREEENKPVNIAYILM